MTFSSPRNPFVGLRPFESHESILFFGRDEQTMELLQRLHQYHFVAVTGSSGCGKSSLIRAGLIPRLKAGYLVDDRDKWMITMMKPGQSPLCNLADAIRNQLNNVNHNLNATAFAEEIREQGIEAIMNILNSLWKNNTNFFLLVDQFEELFRFVLNEREFNKRDEATDFVNILLELSRQPDLPIYVVITVRSDFIGDCAQFYGLPEAMNQSQYIVPRLNRAQLETIIEAPVRLFRDKINPALTAKLLNDVRVIQDELPLLQHALMRIWDHKINVHKSDELDLQDYEFIGGIEKALSNDADEALHGMSEEELGLTKKIFQALTAIDENGRKIRRPARLKDLEAITGANKEQLLTIINRFIEEKRSFLIINKTVNEDDLLIDISHESLIRQWGILSAWVDEEAEACKNYLRLVESARLYQDKKKDWLTGSELQIALQWRKTFNPSGLWAKRYNENFEESIQYLKESERQWKAAQEEKEKERLRKLRNQRLFFAAAVVVIIVISWFTIIIYKNNIENKKQLALNYWKSSQTARAENNFLDALHLIAEAADISSDKELIQNLLIDGEAFLPQACLKNIFSQSDIINSAVFSPDGKWILTAANDGTVRIIDKTTGKQIGHDIKHQALVYSAVFSPDGKWILTASNDSTAALWEVASGKLIKSFKHKDHVTSAVFSPDEKQILTACADKYVRLWDVTTGTRIDSFKHRDNVTSAIFSPDGKLILSVSNNSAQLWNLTAGKQIYLLKHDDLVRSAVFSLSGKLILTASRDSTARLWDVPTGKQIGPVMKHNDEVRSVAFSPDEKRISTGSLDKFARLWDVATQKQIGPAMQHEGPIYNVAFSPDGKWLLTAGGDKTVRLWYLATLPLTTNKINSFKQEHNIVTSAVFSPDTKTILTASWDKTARLWNVVTGKQIFSLKHDSVITSAVFSTNGKLILTASWDSSARLWDAFTGKQIGPVMKHNTPLNSAVFSPDGKCLFWFS